jgi:hypothetical protein
LIRSSSPERNVVGAPAFGRDQRIQSTSDPKLCLALLAQAAAGFALYFFIYASLTGNGSPSTTLVAATLGGAAGLVISGLWIWRIPSALGVQALFLLAFLARLFVGIMLQETIDPNYFDSEGRLVEPNSEYRLTYEAAVKVLRALSFTDSVHWNSILNSGDTKNPFIHWWMGVYLYSAGSDNALDLAVFNSYHHVLGGMFIGGLGVALGYHRRASLIAGVAVAWLPWSFPANIMWRDEVGFAFLTTGLAALVASRASWAMLPLAAGGAYLAYAHRPVYGAIYIMLYFFAAIKQRQLSFGVTLDTGRKSFYAAAAVGIIILISLPDVIFGYRGQFELNEYSSRLLFMPLLILRAIIGPFPWFGVADAEGIARFIPMFDYGFHVIQLAVLVILACNRREFWSGLDICRAAFILIALAAVVAPGVHTAYLAVGLPFLFPFLMSLRISFAKYILGALSAFVIINALYVVLGLRGIGIAQEYTGY